MCQDGLIKAETYCWLTELFVNAVTEGSVVLREGLFSVFSKLYSWDKQSKCDLGLF